MELKLQYLLRILQCILDKFFYPQGQILSYFDENASKALPGLASLENYTLGFWKLFCKPENSFFENIKPFPLTCEKSIIFRYCAVTVNT